MKPAKTFSAMWPASMFANRRTLCEIGAQEEREDLDEDDQRQDADRNAARHEQLEEFAGRSSRSRRSTTVKNTSSASDTVMMMWLVTVNV